MPTLDIFRIAVQLALVSIPFASTPAIPDQPPPPGRLVALGGRKLHLYCTGQGRPTVILETGAGAFSID